MQSPSRKPFSLLLALMLLPLAFTACDSTEPDEGPGEEELITKITLTLSAGGSTVTASANDPDGDGSGFEIDTINLASGTTYTGSIALSDEINGEDITEEVGEEAAEHQFFYTVGGQASNRVSVTITDKDENGLPVGLEFTLAVSGGGATNGTLRVILSHFDDDPKNGTDQSDETDVDVTFPIAVQ